MNSCATSSSKSTSSSPFYLGKIEELQNYLAKTYIETPDTYVEDRKFDCITRALTHFFSQKGYVKICTQNRFGILSACEEPQTVAAIEYCGQSWPLPQTGQMWLEHAILTRPDIVGTFCETTSYREEKNIVPGRHFVSFPLFEFETRGTYDDLVNLVSELVVFLGYPKPIHCDYSETAEKYNTPEIEHEHEKQMCIDNNTSVCLLKMFKASSNPFWNMSYTEDGKLAYKVDVIMSGMEAIGCAERSCDNEGMEKRFYEICDGEYHQLIFNKFGSERTIAELKAFLALPKFRRFGGGIGVTRLISSLEKEGLMEPLMKRFSPQS